MSCEATLRSPCTKLLLVGSGMFCLRQVFLAFVMFLRLGVSAQQTLAPEQQAHTLINSVDAIGMTVSDADMEENFYTQVLSFEQVSDDRFKGDEYSRLENVPDDHIRLVRLRLGDEFIELVQFLGDKGRPVPPDSRSNDRWFQHIAIVVSDMNKAYQKLQENHVSGISTSPQKLPKWNKDAAGIEAYYFQDPDGHPLELLHFPSDKGDAKWHRKTTRVFLGIDHTAIAVNDTEESLKFYRDLLGFRVAGRSLNYGPEQERLSGVSGARVRITSLRLSQAPGIELLEYLEPNNGRPFPTDERSNDIVHHEIDLKTPKIDAAVQQLRTKMVNFISPGENPVEIPELLWRKAMMVRDPDGHAIKVIEK